MSKPHVSAGFTLVEVLVALAILTLGIGLVTVSFRQLADRDLENQAKTISIWMQSLSDRSVLEGSLYGFRVVDDQLQAVSWFDYQWWVVEHEGIISIPENIQFVRGEDQSELAFISAEELSSEDVENQILSAEDQSVEPLMVFMPSGEPLANGELLLQRSMEDTMAIVWTIEGDIHYEDRLSF